METVQEVAAAVTPVVALKGKNTKITDKLAKIKQLPDNDNIPSPEDKQAVLNRIESIKSVMTDEEKKRTTYGIALVKNKDGQKEMWISSAGQKGFVRTDIKGDNKIIKNKLLEGNAENRLNDSEQSLMREAESQGVKILAMGATRDMCSQCQKVASKKGVLGRMVTPLKKITED